MPRAPSGFCLCFQNVWSHRLLPARTLGVAAIGSKRLCETHRTLHWTQPIFFDFMSLCLAWFEGLVEAWADMWLGHNVSQNLGLSWCVSVGLSGCSFFLPEPCHSAVAVGASVLDEATPGMPAVAGVSENIRVKWLQKRKGCHCILLDILPLEKVCAKQFGWYSRNTCSISLKLMKEPFIRLPWMWQMPQTLFLFVTPGCIAAWASS